MLLQDVNVAKQRRNKFINLFYFMWVVFMMQQVFCAFVMMISQVKVIQYTLNESINLVVGYVSLLMVSVNLVFYFTQYLQKKDKRIITFTQTNLYRYPLGLIISYLINILFISSSAQYDVPPYLNSAASALPLLVLVYFRPYQRDQRWVNLITSVICQSSFLLTSLVILFNDITTLSEMALLISAGVVLIMVVVSQTATTVRLIKIVDWSEVPVFNRCVRKTKRKEEEVKGEGEMGVIAKNSILEGGEMKMVNWQDKNRKEYQSVVSQKRKEEKEEQGSEKEEEEEDQLLILKRKLKKDYIARRAV